MIADGDFVLLPFIESIHNFVKILTTERAVSARLMTRVTSIFGETIHKGAVPSVSLDVNFLSNQFPKYVIGANNAIIEPEERPELPSLKEIVAKEASQLLEQQRRLSVRDLAKRFENGLAAAAAKLSDEVLP